MSISSKITGAEFDSMVDRGVFSGLRPREIELIRVSMPRVVLPNIGWLISQRPESMS